MTVSRAWFTRVRTSWRGRAVATVVAVVAVASAAVPRVIATTDVGAAPAGRAVNPRTGTIYVLNSYNDSVDRVAVINPRTNKITTTISFKGTSHSPADLAVSPVTGDVYVTWYHDGNAGGVTVISGRTNKIIAALPFRSPSSGVVSPVNGDFYLANPRTNGHNSLAVINGGKVIATVGVPRAGSVTTISPLTGAIYIAGGKTVTVISGHTNKVVATVAVSRNLNMPMAVSPVTGKVYLENGGCVRESVCTGTVTVISGQTSKIIGAVRLPTPGQEITVSPTTGDTYLLRPENAGNDALPYLLEVLSD